jgi:hypothetical protein
VSSESDVVAVGVDASSAGADGASANVFATSDGDSGGVSNIVVSSEFDAVAVGVDASSVGADWGDIWT